MKKLYVILLLLFLLIPLRVNAVKVNSVQFGDSAAVKTGDVFNVPIDIDFTDVSNHEADSFGIGGITLKIDYDEAVFSLIKVQVPGFNSMYDAEEKTIKSVIDDKTIQGNCVDNILWCGKYEAILTFYVNETDKLVSSVKVNDIVIMGYQLKDGVLESYNKDDILVYSANTTRGQTYDIKSSKEKKEKPKLENEINISKMEEAIADIATKKKEAIINSKVVNSEKEDNNYLKELNIKGYNIDFYKKTYDYELVLDKKINRLVIDAKLDSEKATLEIEGADNLAEANNKVLIKVKAEDGSLRIYTIKVKYEGTTTSKKSIKTIISDIKEIYAEYRTFIIIGAVVVGVLMITLIVINKINDKKLEGDVDKF